jgi:hypothetical protein
MANIGIMNDDAFNVSSLTAAINDAPFAPSRITDLGLFEEDGIQTTTAEVEKDGETLQLVASKQRGAPGQVVVGSKRQMLTFSAVHLPQTAYISADSIQGVRAFGQQTELQVMTDVVNRRLAKMRRQLDATHEWQRVGALNGKILDADGLTVLVDIFAVFGIAQTVIPMAMDTTVDLRDPVLDMLEAMEDRLGNTVSTGVEVLCGRNFWRNLIKHDSIKETYLNTVQAAALRGDPRDSFDFAGATWERYRGRMNGVGFIDDDEAIAVPLGVPELLITRFAPADYMETVNTLGLPYYAKQEIMPFAKGVEIEAQSNPIHLPTRPGAIVRLTA